MLLSFFSFAGPLSALFPPPLFFCFHSPATSLKLLHANIPILPSPPLPPAVLHFPTFPSFISLCALRPDRALSPRRGSSALREHLRSSSLANQFPPESVTPVLFFFCEGSHLPSPPPPLSPAPHLSCPILPFCTAQPLSSLPAPFNPLLLPPPVLPLFGHLSKFCLIRSMLSGDLFPF